MQVFTSKEIGNSLNRDHALRLEASASLLRLGPILRSRESPPHVPNLDTGNIPPYHPPIAKSIRKGTPQQVKMQQMKANRLSQGEPTSPQRVRELLKDDKHATLLRLSEIRPPSSRPRASSVLSPRRTPTFPISPNGSLRASDRLTQMASSAPLLSDALRSSPLSRRNVHATLGEPPSPLSSRSSLSSASSLDLSSEFPSPRIANRSLVEQQTIESLLQSTDSPPQMSLKLSRRLSESPVALTRRQSVMDSDRDSPSHQKLEQKIEEFSRLSAFLKDLIATGEQSRQEYRRQEDELTTLYLDKKQSITEFKLLLKGATLSMSTINNTLKNLITALKTNQKSKLKDQFHIDTSDVDTASLYADFLFPEGRQSYADLNASLGDLCDTEPTTAWPLSHEGDTLIASGEELSINLDTSRKEPRQALARMDRRILLLSDKITHTREQLKQHGQLHDEALSQQQQCYKQLSLHEEVCSQIFSMSDHIV